MTLGGIMESADNPSGMQFRVRAEALAAIRKSENLFNLLKSVAEPIDKITETFKTVSLANNFYICIILHMYNNNNFHDEYFIW